VHSPHPVATGSEAVDNWPAGVQPLHPAPGTGCNRHADGVQPAQSRGAAVAPEPSKEPCIEPSAAPARGRRALPAAGGPGGGGRAGEFFAALGAAWPLTAAQRSRLTPAVLAALNAGWTPHELARFAGANAGGVRNPYTVLADGPRAAAQPQPRQPAPPAWRSCAAGEHRRPGGPAQSPPGAP
jgi:hypothetical protein